jgi:hypothetical protein
MEPSLQIRPKLFEDISGCIDADLKAELAAASPAVRLSA